MTDSRLRNLTIKTNVVKRIMKDKTKYEEEIVKQTKIVENKVAAQADVYEIKMAKAVLEENERMIPDCVVRLKNAIKKLESCAEECEEEFSETEEYQKAKALLQECSEICACK
ncbi:unnamed protein product [Trichobilharzia szidati]|nr:unnamed protein product [Trichobilharzia szidati]